MTVSIGPVQCGICGAELEESPHADPTTRKPCPACGSLARRFGVLAESRAVIRSKLGYKARHAGGGKPFVEGLQGADLHRKTGVWMHLTRIIDRARNWYHERVVNPKTGEVVHECSEALTEHRGHGAARKE